MTDEEIADRRRDFADGGEDSGERLERMLTDIMGGIDKALSPAVTNAHDEAVWDGIAAEIERRRRQPGGPIVSYGLSSQDEGDW